MKFEEVKEIATKYSKYCIAVRLNNMMPMDFDQWYERDKVNDQSKQNPHIDNVINFLNTVCENHGRRGFKLWGKKIRSLISQKLKEGFNVNDFYDVITVKSEWLGDKNMHKYFRPITLFGNKFEDYLNENTKPLEKTTDDKFTKAYKEGLSDNF